MSNRSMTLGAWFYLKTYCTASGPWPYRTGSPERVQGNRIWDFLDIRVAEKARVCLLSTSSGTNWMVRGPQNGGFRQPQFDLCRRNHLHDLRSVPEKSKCDCPGKGWEKTHRRGKRCGKLGVCRTGCRVGAPLCESMQSCGVFKQRQQAGGGLRVGESPGANGEMHLPEWR